MHFCGAKKDKWGVEVHSRLKVNHIAEGSQVRAKGTLLVPNNFVFRG